MENNIPTWTIVLVTTIPALGSIIVAYLANRKSRQTEAKLADVQDRSATREEMTVLLDRYKELYGEKAKEIERLRIETLDLQKDSAVAKSKLQECEIRAVTFEKAVEELHKKLALLDERVTKNRVEANGG